MTATLDEMCETLKRLMRTMQDEADAKVIEAVWVRLSLEKRRRQKQNEKRRVKQPQMRII